jgi:fatty acid/phospholipid biosynthesis enzyme
MLEPMLIVSRMYYISLEYWFFVCRKCIQIKNPKVGLLNIGEEPEKGNLVTQAAHLLMKDTKDFNFIGNVEGRDLFNE